MAWTRTDAFPMPPRRVLLRRSAKGGIGECDNAATRRANGLLRGRACLLRPSAATGGKRTECGAASRLQRTLEAATHARRSNHPAALPLIGRKQHDGSAVSWVRQRAIVGV